MTHLDAMSFHQFDSLAIVAREDPAVGALRAKTAHQAAPVPFVRKMFSRHAAAA